MQFNVRHEDDKTSLESDHADPGVAFAVVADQFGSASRPFVDGILKQLACISQTDKRVTAKELNFVSSVVHGIAPRDPTEALLASQMAAIHNATMIAAQRLARSETIEQRDSASNMLNKLARTFAAQTEALKRYRATGEQSIRVQHVNVSAGQAVVGINQGGGVAHEKRSQPHVPSRADEPSAALLCHGQAVPVPLSSSGREGLARLPVPRRTRRSAQGKANRAWRHGMASDAAKAERRATMALLREARAATRSRPAALYRIV